MKDKIYNKSILQNSTIVIKVSGKIISNQRNIINIANEYKNGLKVEPTCLFPTTTWSYL